MNKSRLIVVDHDPTILEMCTSASKLEGFEVRGAANGREGLALAREVSPDIALVDVDLPDLTGREVCRLMKADPALSNTVVVLLSAQATDAKAHGTESGADDYLLKTDDWHDIRTRLRTLLRLREARTALQFSEEHYRSLVEILPDAVAVLELNGRLTAVNPSAVLMTGFSNRAELMEKSIFDLVISADRERLRADLADGLAVGIIRNKEYVALKKDGAVYPVELSATVLRDGRGIAFALVCVIRDATQRRQTEEQLRLLADAVRSTRDLIFITDAVHRFVFVNEALLDAFGFKQPELLGESCEILFSTGNRPGIQEKIKKKTLQGGWRGEVFCIKKDGTVFPVSLSGYPIRNQDGGVLNLIYVGRDVSERKRAQEELEESRRRQKAILDNIADPAWLKDLEGNFLAGNEPLASFLRRPLTGVLGRTVFEFLPQPEAERLTQADNQVIRTGRSITADQMLMDRNQQARWFEILRSPIFSKARQVVGTVGIARDITKRKRAETLLYQQYEFSLFLAGANDLKEASRRLIERAMALQGVDCAWLHWVDAQSGALTLEVYQGVSSDFATGISHFAQDSEQARILRSISKSAESVGHLWAGLIGKIASEGVVAIEVVPVRNKGQIVALLTLGAYNAHGIPLHSRLAIQATLAQVGGAIARIQIEQSLRVSRELLEKTIHSLHAAVLRFDAESLIVRECNPAGARIFGNYAGEIVGRNIEAFQVNEHAFGRFKERLLSVAKMEGIPPEFDFQLKRPSGVVFQTIQCVTPVRDAAGRLDSWVWVVHDVTARALAEAELRQLPQRIIEAQEAEQLRVARDLHDSVNQVVASVKMRLRHVGERLAQTDRASHEILSRCEKLLVQAIEENRRIAHNLRPSDLDEFGLAVACRNFCDQFQARSGLKVERRISKTTSRLPAAVELNVFRILQEAVNNVEKHARATTVRLRLTFTSEEIILQIEDDGRGFAPAKSRVARGKVRRGIGLTNMQQRAALIGAVFSVESVPNRGTCISVIVPLERPG